MGDRLAIRNSKSASNLKTSDLKSEIPRATNTSSGVACTERQKGEESEQISMAQRSPQTERVLVYPINVGQGDAILLEIQSTDGQSEKHLIDGGCGQKGEKKYYYENLKRTLRDHKCLEQKQVRMGSIIVTHPDRDHYGGINRLLQDFTITAPITTTLASCLEVNGSDTQLGEVFLLDKRHQIRHCFPLTGEGENGRRHTNIETLSSKGSTVEVAKNEEITFEKKLKKKKCKAKKHKAKKQKAKKRKAKKRKAKKRKAKKRKAKRLNFNATSILTTVSLQLSTCQYDYDVVLTGDSYCTIIEKKLELALKGKSVGVFQVPHHGSSYNLDNKKTTRSTAQEFTGFYSSFNAYIYLISHGDHKKYNHPHSEVITGILSAAVQKKRDPKCKIVVTATWFEKSKIDETNISNWRDYVDIYYFKQDTPYVTLDPNDEKLHEGLQLFVKKVPERPVENFPTDQTPEREQSEGTQSSQGSIVPRRRLFKNKEKLCPICKKRVSLTDIWYICNNNKCPHADCEEESRKTLTFGREFKKCVYCRTCKECNGIMGTVHASCHLCGSAVHKQCITNCKQTTKGYTCRICREQSL